MAESRAIKRLLKALENIKAQVNTFTVETQISDIKTYSALLADEWKEFQTLEKIVKGKFDDAHEISVDKIESTHFELKRKLTKFEKLYEESHAYQGNCSMDDLLLNQSNFLQQMSVLGKRDSEVRLPRVNIPPFSGKYSEFPSFRDLFEASIHTNNNISKVHKLQYLKGLLKGEAYALINHITVTDANYDEAWDKIKIRYDKRKHVVHTLLKQFMEQPNLHQSCSKALRQLSEVSDEVMRGLKVLGGQAESRDPWIIYILTNKLDNDSKEAWAHETAENDFPTLAQLFAFLNKRSDALENLNSMQKSKGIPAKRINSLVSHSISVICPLCSEEHYLGKCEQFLNLTIPERKQLTAEKKLCFNCLSSNHQSTVCRSRFNCRICRRRHHITLHPESTADASKETGSSKVGSNSTEESTNCSALLKMESPQTNKSQAILPTAMVLIKDKFGKLQRCRALLDSGSQATFVSENCVQRLQLKRHTANVRITGVTNSSVISKGKTVITIGSLYDSASQFEINALIVNHLPSRLPRYNIISEDTKFFQNMQLADPDYGKPAPIDILIGADKFFTVLESGQKQFNSIVLQKTVFGWIVSGQPQSANNEDVSTFMALNIQLDMDIDGVLRKFWEIEEVPKASEISPEEQECEEFFLKTHKREDNGRYVVNLPFNKSAKNLGDSLYTARQRFFSLERKLSSDESLRSEYTNQIREYIEMGHMVEIPEARDIPSQEKIFYLPHHSVRKESSNTTKVRVVFDGSSKSSTGISLNDKLMVGPTIQPTLWSTLLRFRRHRIAVIADIEKMYRQIIVASHDADYQRVLWRENANQKLRHYKLTRVTFGLACSAYLAIRTLQQLARDDGDDHIYQHVINDFYVDDFLSGSQDEQSAIQLKENISRVLQQGGFLLRKWRSNIQVLCDEVNNTTTTQLYSDKTSIVTVLGLHWYPKDDIFTFKVNPEQDGQITKRKIISEASRVFDPLGFLSPSVILLKIVFQKLWLLKIDWDDKLPEEFQKEYRKVRGEFSYFEQVKIPRFINHCGSVQIHGFADASEVAYSAVIYSRVTNNNGEITVNLLTSKTKVTPIKKISIPRLELCAAQLLSQLMSMVRETLAPTASFYAWTDSAIVLAWLSAYPARWKTFVANRTSQILDKFPVQHWAHVKSSDNPADHGSRGVSPQRLLNLTQWWHGPEWLKSPENLWPTTFPNDTSSKAVIEKELNKSKLHTRTLQATIDDDWLGILFARISKLTQIYRIVAYVIRYTINSKIKDLKHRNTFELNSKEISDARTRCIIWVKNEAFSEDIKSLRKNNTINNNSKLLSLAPFIDIEGVLRVGGRLENADCDYNNKHPVILPSNHVLSESLIREIHHKNFHAGPTLTNNLIRQQYWIVNGRNKIRAVLKHCVICVRYAHKNSAQLMGNLPVDRVTPTMPFINCGIDFAGPLYFATKKGRGGTNPIKGYLCIFVCFSVKAVHIEPVSDLTSEAFLAVLKRFTARRGIPKKIYSDHGSNFVGAKRILNEALQLIQNINKNYIISEYLSDNTIEWHFIPPAAPHFGGLWESAVKSVKTHLLKSTKNVNLTFEEMTTLLCQIENILNSRPLCTTSVDDDYEVLTPAHFLIGTSTGSVPETQITTAAESSLSRWQRIQARIQIFWKKYHRDYLNNLQQRYKWQKPKENVKVGDIVLITEDNIPVCKWPLGQVTQIHPGKDHLVRVVTVKTANSTLQRPIVKICERLIQYASENLVTEILIHPQYNTLIQCMRNLLSSFTRHRHIIHAGYTFAGNGSWILQDGTFSVSDFSEAFQENDVQRVLRAYPDTITMDIHCESVGLWSALPDKNFAKSCRIRINPNDVLNSGSDKINSFIDYVAPMIVPASLTDLLESSDVVGNIRFSHPTLYVFPGGQGDAALFGINGFNMLVDGGFGRKACFWDFTRHLDRLDAVLMTRISNCNINGLGAVVERKRGAHVYPQIGHFFCNVPERKGSLSPGGDKDSKDPLLVDLYEKGTHLVNNLRAQNLGPQTCYQDSEPINLYHKVGHGTLDMYVLSPSRDAKEVKEFLQKWNTNDSKLFQPKDTKEFVFPVQNLISICALLVWLPANPDDSITRILFPGSTPDYKIIEGLEKIKHLEFMKNPVCTTKSIAPSISSSTLSKKSIKSVTGGDKASDLIIPQRPMKSVERDNKTIDNKFKDEVAEKRKSVAKPRPSEPAKKIEKIDNKVAESEKIEEPVKEMVKDGELMEEKEDKEKTIDESEAKTDIETKDEEEKDSGKEKVIEPEIKQEPVKDASTEKDEADTTKAVAAQATAPAPVSAKTKPTVEPKSAKKPDAKPIKSRIDTRPPRSMTTQRQVIKKEEKKEISKASPTTTPKKTAPQPKETKEIKSKVASRFSRSSPSSTPAKSAKDANNRKVLESKQKIAAAKKEPTPKPAAEKKEPAAKPERKPISRRAKAESPSRRPPTGSPVKTARPARTKAEKDKGKLEKGGTTDSSLVSTPSADDGVAVKKVIVPILEPKPSTESTANAPAIVDDLKEEQECIREIEAVFSRDHDKVVKKEVLPDRREVAETSKQDSTTEAEEDEEYLIIEKEEVEQYTEDSINEQESLTKEEEIQKHQRDSEESEKKRKSSVEEAQEEKPMAKEKAKVVEIIEGVDADKDVVSEKKDNEPEDDDMQPDSIEEDNVPNKEQIKEEVQEIITSAKEIAKTRTESRDEIAIKTEEFSTPSIDEKISSNKRTSEETNDEKGEDQIAVERQQIVEQSQPDEKFSATIESGATTAPTLPEDERIPLDEIKEDLDVVEEKYAKEETKETETAIEAIQTKKVGAQPQYSMPPPPTYEPLERQQIPTQIKFDMQQGHLRDIVKTPDEVADLPVHEEVDYVAGYDDYHHPPTTAAPSVPSTGKSIDKKTDVDHDKKTEADPVKHIEDQIIPHEEFAKKKEPVKAAEIVPRFSECKDQNELAEKVAEFDKIVPIKVEGRLVQEETKSVFTAVKDEVTESIATAIDLTKEIISDKNEDIKATKDEIKEDLVKTADSVEEQIQEEISKVIDEAEKIQEDLKMDSETVKDEIVEKIDHIKETVTEQKDKLIEDTTKTAEADMEKGNEITEEIKDKATDVLESAADAKEKLIEEKKEVEDAIESAKEHTSSKVEDIKDEIADQEDKISDGVKDAKEKTAEEIKEKVDALDEAVIDAIIQIVEDATQKRDEEIEKTKDTLSEDKIEAKSDTVVKDAEKIEKDVAGKKSPVADKISEITGDVVEDTKETAEETKDAIKDGLKASAEAVEDSKEDLVKDVKEESAKILNEAEIITGDVKDELKGQKDKLVTKVDEIVDDIPEVESNLKDAVRGITSSILDFKDKLFNDTKDIKDDIKTDVSKVTKDQLLQDFLEYKDDSKDESTKAAENIITEIPDVKKAAVDSEGTIKIEGDDKDVKDDIKTATQKLIDETKETAKYVEDDIKTATQNLIDEAKESAEEVEAKAAEIVEFMTEKKDWLKEKMQDVNDLSAKLDDIKAKTAGFADGSDFIAETKQSFSDEVSKLEDEIDDAKDEIKEEVLEKADSLKEQMTEKAAVLKEESNKTKDSILEKVKDVLAESNDEITAKLGDTTEKLSATVSKAADEVKDVNDKLVCKAADTVGVSQDKAEKVVSKITEIKDEIVEDITEMKKDLADIEQEIKKEIKSLESEATARVDKANEISTAEKITEPAIHIIDQIVKATDIITDEVDDLSDNAKEEVSKHCEKLEEVKDKVVENGLDAKDEVKKADNQLAGDAIKETKDTITEGALQVKDEVKEIISDEVTKAVENVDSEINDVKEDAKKGVAEAKDKIDEKLIDTKEQIEETKQVASSEVDKAIEAATVKIDDTKDKAASEVNKVAEHVEVSIEDTKDKVAAKIEDSKDKAEDGLTKILDIVEDVQTSTASKIEETKEKITDEVTKLDEIVEDKVEDIKTKAEDTVEKASRAVDAAADKIGDTKEEATAAAANGTDTVEAKIESTKDKIEETVQIIDDKIEQTEDKAANEVTKAVDLVATKSEVAKEVATAELAKTDDTIVESKEKVTTELAKAIDSTTAKIEDTKEKAGEIVEAKVDEAKDLISTELDTATAKLEETTEKMATQIGKVADSIEAKVDESKEKVATAFDSAATKIEDTKEKAGIEVAKAVDSTDVIVDETKDKISTALDSAATKVEDTKETAVADVAKAVDTIEAKIDDTKEKMATALDSAASKIEDTKEKAATEVAEAVGSIEAKVDKTKDKMSTALDSTAIKMEETKEKAATEVSKAVDSIEVKIVETKDKMATALDSTAIKIEETKEKAATEVSKAVHSIEAKIVETKDKMATALDSATTKIEETKEKAAAEVDIAVDSVEVKVDETKDKMATALESAASKIEDTKEKAATEVATAVDSIKAKVDETKDKTANAIDSATTKIEETKEAVAAEVVKAAESVDEKLKSAADKIDETKSKASEEVVKAIDKVDEAIKSADTKMDETKEKISTEVTKAVDATSAVIEETKEKLATEVTKAVDATSAKVEETKEKLATEVTKAVDATTTKVEETKDKIESKIDATKDTIDKELTKAAESIEKSFDSTKEKIESVKEEIQEKTKSGISSFFGGISQGIKSGFDKLTDKIEDKPKEAPKEEIELAKKPAPTTFDIKTFPTELRETHITTLDSPIKDQTERVGELKTLEKLPEQTEEEIEDMIKPSMTFQVEEVRYTSPAFDREDSSLNDIKEEEEEDHFSPPRKASDSEKYSRSVSPRTQEDVIKIVANVAEVLKSDKDLEEIIPDFDPEELEKKLSARASPVPLHQTSSPEEDGDDENVSKTVQRMLVTASSEDGGGEIEICPQGSITFEGAVSGTATPDLRSGRHSPEELQTEEKSDQPKDPSTPTAFEEDGIQVADNKADTSLESSTSVKSVQDGSKEDKTPQSSGKSTPELKTSPSSIDEKEKHELPEKMQKREETTKSIPTITSTPSEKIEPSILVHEADTRKESVASEYIDGVLDSRRESAINSISEKDYTKEESSIGIDDKELSTISHASDKSIEDIRDEIETTPTKVLSLEKDEVDAGLQKPGDTSEKSDITKVDTTLDEEIKTKEQVRLEIEALEDTIEPDTTDVGVDEVDKSKDSKSIPEKTPEKCRSPAEPEKSPSPTGSIKKEQADTKPEALECRKTETIISRPDSPASQIGIEKSDTRPLSAASQVSDKAAIDKIESRPESAASNLIDPKPSQQLVDDKKSSPIKSESSPDSAPSQIGGDILKQESRPISAASHTSDLGTDKEQQSRPESRTSDKSRSPSVLSDHFDDEILAAMPATKVVMKETRSKSVASIMTGSMYKEHDDLKPLSALEEVHEYSKDDTDMLPKYLGSSKTSISSLNTIEKSPIKKSPEPVAAAPKEIDMTKSVLDGIWSEVPITPSVETAKPSSSKTSPSEPHDTVSLSGKSTPDIADVIEEKVSPGIPKESTAFESGHKTPPTVPVSPNIKSDIMTQSMMQMTASTMIIEPEIHSGKSSPGLIQTSSESASKSTSVGQGSGVDTTDSSPKPTSPFPKGIQTIKDEVKTSSGMSTPDMTRMSTPDIMDTKYLDKSETGSDSVTTVTATTITTKTTDSSDTSKVVEKSDKVDSTVAAKSSFTPSQPISKDVANLKTSEMRSFTPGMEDYDPHDVSSPRSDISSGQASRIVPVWTPGSSEERHIYSDDEVPSSPMSVTSHAAHSPPSKFAYEDPYDLQRSSSGVSKKSDLDIDDSQDDIPPQYGSEELKSAISISSSYRPDPMSTSFYGALPDMTTTGKSEPIPIAKSGLAAKSHLMEYNTSSGPSEDSTTSSFSGASKEIEISGGLPGGIDHKFLDEADLDFEKALEEHRQVRGADVMSSITSKYDYSPTRNVIDPKTSDSSKVPELPKKGGEPVAVVPTTTQPSTSSSSSSITQSSSQQSQSQSASQQQQQQPPLSKEKEDFIASWGKPLGLPAPAPIPVENNTTPKKDTVMQQRRMVVNSKTKLNNEKNLRKRSESPVKGNKKNSPIYMDLTYVPHHGNSYYSHVEFFKRVRARYYVFSGTEPSREVYNALLEAKQTWEDKDLEVTIIPTYDTDVLGYWVSENEDLLAKYHIDLSPSASRCTINLQDHETSCSAYRLEF